MKSIITRIFVAIFILLVLPLALFVLRIHVLDVGVVAWKENRGATALTYIEPLAQIGDPIAQLILVDLYAYGAADIQKDAVKADYWIERAAWFGKNDPTAQELAIAKSFANGGNGIKQDTAESIKWLRLSAQKGNKEAADLLAKSGAQ